jgi:hypothetical protein
MRNTIAGGSRLLWTGCEVGIRILPGFIMWMLKVFTKFVMCSIWNVNFGEGFNIRRMWTRQVRIRWKLGWTADMMWGLTKCNAPHNI